MVAAPIGMPGCPESAFWTASIDSMRIVLMQSWSRSSRDLAVSNSGCVAGRWFMIGTESSLVTYVLCPVRRSAQYFFIRWLTARLSSADIGFCRLTAFAWARRASLLTMNDTGSSSASNAS